VKAVSTAAGHLTSPAGARDAHDIGRKAAARLHQKCGYPSRAYRRIVTPGVMALGVAPSGKFNRFVIVIP
jgi:hypothetical protein